MRCVEMVQHTFCHHVGRYGREFVGQLVEKVVDYRHQLGWWAGCLLMC